MTEEAINAQIEAIKSATAKAMQSKETALQFLIDAGIVKLPVEKPTRKKKSSN